MGHPGPIDPEGRVVEGIPDESQNVEVYILIIYIYIYIDYIYI